MAGINLKLLADTSNLIKGTKDAGGALDDVADSLDDLARESRKSSGKVEDDMRDIARAGDKAADAFEDDMKKAFRTVERESKDTGRKVERNVSDSFDSAGNVSGEFKDEARSNFSEIASSFDGSMDSIADLAQGTFGGLAGSLAGPLGLAAGAFAAVGGAMYASFNSNAAKSEERISDMYDDMLESGTTFLSNQFIAEELQKIYGKTEDAAVSWKRLTEVVKITGEEEATVARAFAGDATARAQVIDTLQSKYDDLGEEMETAWGDERVAIGDAMSQLGRYRDELNGMSDEQDDAASRVRGYRDAVKEMNTALTNVPYKTGANVEMYFNKMDAQRSIDSFISDIERRRITLSIDPKLNSHGRSTA